MRIKFQFEAQLRQAAQSGARELELDDGTNLLDALQTLAEQSGAEFAERLLNSDHEPRRSILLFINDEPVQQAAAAQTALKDGDRVLLFPPISGG